jgi:hypothetical protein
VILAASWRILLLQSPISSPSSQSSVGTRNIVSLRGPTRRAVAISLHSSQWSLVSISNLSNVSLLISTNLYESPICSFLSNHQLSPSPAVYPLNFDIWTLFELWPLAFGFRLSSPFGEEVTFSPCSNEEFMLISAWNSCATPTNHIPQVRLPRT